MLTRIKIRQENSADENKVFELIKNTFAHAEHTDGDEHNLVNRLRESEGFIPELSLVAEFENEIIGHILLHGLKLAKQCSLRLPP